MTVMVRVGARVKVSAHLHHTNRHKFKETVHRMDSKPRMRRGVTHVRIHSNTCSKRVLSKHEYLIYYISRDLLIWHRAKFRHFPYCLASDKMQYFSVVTKQTQNSPDAIIRC